MGKIIYKFQNELLGKYINKYFENIELAKKVENKIILTDDLSIEGDCVIYFTDRIDLNGENIINLPQKRISIRKKIEKNFL